MEPWDGPAGIVLTDGHYAPARSTATACGRPLVITKKPTLTSPPNRRLDYKPEDVVRKGKTRAGEIVALDSRPAPCRDPSRFDAQDAPRTRPGEKGRALSRVDLIDPRLAAEPWIRHPGDLPEDVRNLGRRARRCDPHPGRG